MFNALENNEGGLTKESTNLLDSFRQEAWMTNKFESRPVRESAASVSLPDLSLAGEQIAKVETATRVKSSPDGHGGSRNDYYLGDNLVFSDNNNHGVRTRTSYDMLGRAEGKRSDYPDGRSDSIFKGDFDTYKVMRDKTGITVVKNEGGTWMMVTDPEESSEILQKEKQLFTPPRVIGKS